jgi:hypothetical protein
MRSSDYCIIAGGFHKKRKACLESQRHYLLYSDSRIRQGLCFSSKVRSSDSGTARLSIPLPMLSSPNPSLPSHPVTPSCTPITTSPLFPLITQSTKKKSKTDTPCLPAHRENMKTTRDNFCCKSYFGYPAFPSFPFSIYWVDKRSVRRADSPRLRPKWYKLLRRCTCSWGRV